MRLADAAQGVPALGTVHYYYRRFRLDGTWEHLHYRLRERVRRKVGKKPTPTAAVIYIEMIHLIIHRLHPG
jgi:putative transposase